MSSLRGTRSPRARRGGSSDELEEAVEEVHGVVGAGARLWVVLSGRACDVLQHKSLHRPVIEIHMTELGDSEIGLPAHRLVDFDAVLAIRPDHGEAVVLRG